MIIMSEMIFGSKYQLLYMKKEIKIEIANMKMLRWMCYITLLNKIMNKCIRKNLGLMNMAKKLKRIN